MHFLDRQKTAEPGCLRRLRHPQHNWDDIADRDRAEIWVELTRLQGRLCAYCERDMQQHGHIEHFRSRARFPKKTFEWSNLYGSCDDRDSCGHYKETRTYEPDELIEPGRDDPDRLLVFAPDGSIAPRTRLKDHERRKVDRTMTFLALDAVYGPPRKARQEVAQAFLTVLEEARRALPEEELNVWLEAELQHALSEPHPTVVRHLLEAQPTS